jgi:hypothetical protein
MSKASEVARRLRERTLSPEQLAERGHAPLPKLRLRSDAPSVEAEGVPILAEALQRLPSEESGALVIRGTDGEPKGVILSPERYFELVGTLLRQNQHLQDIGPWGFIPTEESFAATLTEQVDLNEPWAAPGNPIRPMRP